jgi:hypothetical protein
MCNPDFKVILIYGGIIQTPCEEYINMNINLPDLDFAAAGRAAAECELK